MTRRPDPHILVATILVIVLLAYGWAGYGVWDFAGRPMP